MKTCLELLVENSLDAPQIVCLVEAVVVSDYALQVCILLDILLGPAPVDPPPTTRLASSILANAHSSWNEQKNN